jgi:hypothetical protein
MLCYGIRERVKTFPLLFVQNTFNSPLKLLVANRRLRRRKKFF